jgi:ribulose-phosphate 3-epimerase
MRFAFVLALAARPALAFTVGPARAALPAHRAQPQMKSEYRIAPSILSADFARLGEEVENVLAAGADVVHFDVMDNHFVPNLTIGPLVCSALKKRGIKAPIDVHLMVTPVDEMINDFAEAGADYITFHPEATQHIDRSLSLIRSKGCKSGLVFNPSTDLSCLKYVMDKVDIILLMSVNPGFGGQAFIPNTLAKAREARKLIDESGYDITLEIDGGVGVKNIREVAEAGVDMFVAGSAIFNSPSCARRALFHTSEPTHFGGHSEPALTARPSACTGTRRPSTPCGASLPRPSAEEQRRGPREEREPAARVEPRGCRCVRCARKS